MKATIGFDLNDEDDRKAHLRCVKATDAYLAIHDIQNEFRMMQRQLEVITDYVEFNHKFPLLESIKDRFYEIIEEHGINTDDLN